MLGNADALRKLPSNFKLVRDFVFDNFSNFLEPNFFSFWATFSFLKCRESSSSSEQESELSLEVSDKMIEARNSELSCSSDMGSKSSHTGLQVFDQSTLSSPVN